MEFYPAETKKKKIWRYLIFAFIIILLLFVCIVEIVSPIYVNHFEDLDVKAESERIGGSFYNNNGDELYYADYKKDNADPILFIHGFGASSFSWRNNIKGLYTKYHVITVDLLGFGLSKNLKSSDIELDRDVSILQSFIHDMKLTNLTIVAHSMGGLVAQKLAISDQKNIKSLVLINSMDAQNPQDNNNVILNKIVGFPAIKNPLGMISESTLIPELIHKSYYDQSLIDKLTIEGYQKGYRYKGSLDAAIKFIKSSNPKKEDLSKIKQPTLIYSSQNDEIVNPSVEKTLNNEIPLSHLISIPRSGHLLMEEQPSLVNEGIDKWIQNVKANENVA